jgi:multidrug resistance efflux pump
VLAVGGLLGGWLGWQAFTRVRVVGAYVRAFTAPCSPDVDGRLAEVYVKENVQVTAGQSLARLDDEQFTTALKAAEAAQASKESQHGQAQAELSRITERLPADLQVAQARVLIASARVQSAQAALDLRQAQLAEEIKKAEAECAQSRASLQQQLNGTREEDLLAAEARLESAGALLALAELEVRQSQELVQEGIDSQYILEVRRTNLITRQKAVREAELELRRLKAGPRPEEVERARQDLAAREAALAIAKAASGDVERLKAELRMRQAEQQEAEAGLRAAQAEQATLELARKRLEAAARDFDVAKAEVEQRRADLARVLIKSTVSGMVTRVYDEVGEFCRRGVATVLVTDDSKGRWVEGYVAEQDALLVKVGQRAWIKVPARGGDWVEATVERVGLHTQSLDDSATGLRGAATYGQPERVWLMLSAKKPLKGNPLPGMTAKAYIRVR